MTTILGMNCYHADSSACIVRQNRLVTAVEEERFRRVKHWAGFPAESIRCCLDQADVTIDQGIALLTGRVSGQRGAENSYPADSINGLIETRLRSFARTLEKARRALSHEQGET